MDYKTLLVHLDDSAHCTVRRDFAISLALKYDAHLIGLYAVCKDLTRPMFIHGETFLLAVAESQSNARENTAHDAFVAAAQHAGCRFEWRAPTEPPTEAVTLHARHADLLIFGQYDPKDPVSYVAKHFIDDTLISCGRPAIVLPASGIPPRVGGNVVVAWDGSREAARALSDALPLLQGADFVTVVEVPPRTGRADGSGIDISAYLDRQGIRASFTTVPKALGQNAGAALLEHLAALHADLLVMGAFRHTRAHERILGGVTQTMLESMTTPVLMSH